MGTNGEFFGSMCFVVGNTRKACSQVTPYLHTGEGGVSERILDSIAANVVGDPLACRSGGSRKGQTLARAVVFHCAIPGVAARKRTSYGYEIPTANHLEPYC